MTVQTDVLPEADEAAEVGFEEFALDVRFVESGPVIADLMRQTDDNCGSTCQSACSNSGC
jgi:FxLD family lantipeptide